METERDEKEMERERVKISEESLNFKKQSQPKLSTAVGTQR